MNMPFENHLNVLAIKIFSIFSKNFFPDSDIVFMVIKSVADNEFSDLN